MVFLSLLVCSLPSQLLKSVETHIATILNLSDHGLSTDSTKEWLAHFSLMAAIAFFWMLSYLSSSLRLRCIVRTGGMALLVVALTSTAIELIQALLPASFQRGFSWDDLGSSMLGGVSGGLLGIGMHKLLSKKFKNSNNEKSGDFDLNTER